jgi:hypothetical protein
MPSPIRGASASRPSARATPTRAPVALEIAAHALALRCRASGVPPMEALSRVDAVTRPARTRAGTRERTALSVTVFGAFLGAYYGASAGRPATDGERDARRTCTARRPTRPARENVP